MSSRHSKSFVRHQSLPSSSPALYGWFREQSNIALSPKSDDSERSFDSDEENVAMDTDCHITAFHESDHGLAVPSTPLLSSVISSTTNTLTLQKPSYSDRPRSLHGERSKSLLVGRPMRSVGLKDLDLTKNRRAREIRQAKAANSHTENRHIPSPVRQNSSPACLTANMLPISDGYHGDGYYGDTGCHSEPHNRSSLSLASDSSGRVAKETKHHYSLQPNMKSLPYQTKYVTNVSKSTNSKVKTKMQPRLYSSEFIPDEIWHDAQCLINANDVIEIEDDTDEATYDGDDHSIDFREHQVICRPRFNNDEKKNGKSIVLPSFSDEEDDDICDHGSADASSPADVSKPVTSCKKHANTTKRRAGTICGVITSSIAVVIMASLYIHLNPLGLCLNSEFRVNLTGLENDLRQEFYGQHLAMKILLSSFKSRSQGNRNKPLVLSLHGWTGTGKNYVSGMITKHLFKHGIQSKFVYKFIIPLHFPHISNVHLYREQLRDWIVGNVSNCNKGGLFIFDEMDKIPHGLVSVLKPFLDHKGLKSGLDFRNVVFLFLSNSGGKLINQHVLEHYKEGYARQSIELINLESLLHRYAEDQPGAWYKELLQSEVIDHFVPFLPLERSHIKQCIQTDMENKGYPLLETMVTEIANEMGYFPQDLQIFSVSGCKKVSSKVDVAMG